ncbi:MAG TPA: mechanosensitive ion channel family protein [Stellaceae bacterium]|jgi:small conductance mechanosensitive channel|nr:mechanosensitive ion channel family protein [Stellaceae bacterium]
MDFLDTPTAAVFWANLTHYGIALLGAVLILVIGWWLAGWASRSMQRSLSKRHWMDATLLPLIVSIVRYTILVVALLAVLSQFGIEMTSLVAVLGAAGLAIGLALQGTLSNVAAGVMLVGLRPFHVGQAIQAAGFTGTVQEVGLFATVIRADDNRVITLPNKLLSDAPIVNFSRLPVQSTVNITFLLPYAADIGRALEVLRRIAVEQHNESALIGVEELGDAAIKLRLQAIVPMADADAAKLAFNLAIRQQLAAADIQFMQEAAPAVYDLPQPAAQPALPPN